MKWIKKTTNIIVIAVLVLGISVGTLVTTCQQAYAIGPVLKVVGGETLDQIMQGMAYKLGSNFADDSAMDKARGRWNLDGYQKAQDYENKLNAEEKARWDKFNSEVNNAPIQPTGKPGIGKILLSGAAFLTGADLIYNSYKAYQAGVSSGEMEVADYDAPAYNVDYNGVSGVTLERVGTWEGTGKKSYRVLYNGTYIDSVTGVGSIYDWGGYTSTFLRRTGANTFDVYARYKNNPGYKQDTFSIPNYQPVGGLPSIKRVAITPNDMGVVPSPALDSVPRIEGTSLPNPSQIILPDPDAMIEIEVPLQPGPNPGIQPLTDEEWDKIINPGDIPDPNKPPGDDVDPDAPPGTDPDAPPGTDPDAPPGTDPDAPPGTDPDAPPGTNPDEEIPPKGDEETPPKEDEENSCGESLKKPDFKQVGVAFTNAFPFSLPWDLKRFFDAAFSGIGSEKPSVDLPFLGDGVTLTIPDYFDSWVDVAKNLMIIMFDISLIWMFARFMQRGGGD